MVIVRLAFFYFLFLNIYADNNKVEFMENEMMYSNKRNEFLAFTDKKEISNWAKKKFLGGSIQKTFNFNDLEVLCVIGSYTSGLYSSQVYIFLYDQKTLYWKEILATRKIVNDEISVKFKKSEKDVQIEFYSVLTKKILFTINMSFFMQTFEH